MVLTAVGFFSMFSGISPLAIVLFIIGLLLMIAEIFAPGFGIAGGAGLVLLVIAILLTARELSDFLILFGLLILLVGGILAIILWSAKRGKLSKKLILWSSAKREDGFSSSSDKTAMLGTEGVALTVLRPSGTGMFGKDRLDIVTEGSYIAAGTPVVITRVEGHRIVVEPAVQAKMPEQPS